MALFDGEPLVVNFRTMTWKQFKETAQQSRGQQLRRHWGRWSRRQAIGTLSRLRAANIRQSGYSRLLPVWRAMILLPRQLG